MKWMKPAFDNTLLAELGGRGGGVKWCWHNIRKDGYLMMMLDYNVNAPNYVIGKLLSN